MLALGVDADMRRREFISLVGGAAAGWRLRRAAQQPAKPIIGFLDPRSPEAFGDRLRAFRQGLRQTAMSRART